MKTLILSSSLSPSSKSFLLCKSIEKKLTEKDVTCVLIDARNMNLFPFHKEPSQDMNHLKQTIKEIDNLIIGMGVHCYSLNDSLKILLDNCFEEAKGKFYGIVCAAGGQKSYLSTQHLTQICMNEWRMIQLPKIVYATSNDFDKHDKISHEINNRIQEFVDDFYVIGKKLLT